MASYFNERNAHPENVMMPVDIGIMATIADQMGHETLLIDTEAEAWTLDSLAARIRDLRPGLIFLKAKSPSNRQVFSLFRHPDLRDLDTEIIGFSHAFGESPETFLISDIPVSCVIVREPEATMREVLSKWTDGSWRAVRGIAYRHEDQVIRTEERELLDDLDELPVPKYDWFLNSRYFTYYPMPPFIRKKVGFMLAGRGCPKTCIYCSPTLRQTYGAKFRAHSVERIVDEMEYLRSRGVRVVQFRDDLFTLDRLFVERLCQRILSRGLKLSWIAQTHVNHVDEKLLALMKSAGCITLGFGIESGSERVLSVLKKHNNLQHARGVFAICRRLGIRTVGFFLVGCPGETLQEVVKTRSLIRELSPDLIQVALFTPYKGSKAFDFIDKSSAEKSADFHHYNKIVHNFSSIDLKTLEDLPKRLYLEYIFTPRVFLRLALGSIAGIVVDPVLTLRMIVSGFRFLVLRKRN